MAKIAYNACHGGFALSRSAVLRAREISGDPKWGGACINGDVFDDGTACLEDYGSIENVPRDNAALVQVIEELGSAANGSCAKLKIKELPPGTSYRIDDHDGYESVMTADDYVWITAH